MSCLEIAHDGVEWEKEEVPVTLKCCGSNKVNCDHKMQLNLS